MIVCNFPTWSIHLAVLRITSYERFESIFSFVFVCSLIAIFHHAQTTGYYVHKHAHRIRCAMQPRIRLTHTWVATVFFLCFGAYSSNTQQPCCLFGCECVWVAMLRVCAFSIRYMRLYYTLRDGDTRKECGNRETPSKHSSNTRCKIWGYIERCFLKCFPALSAFGFCVTVWQKVCVYASESIEPNEIISRPRGWKIVRHHTIMNNIKWIFDKHLVHICSARDREKFVFAN